jgi:hypothetical protein
MKKALLLVVAIVFATVIYAQKTTDIKTKDLPKATTEWVTTNMPKATIDKAVKLDDKGTITYNILVLSAGRKHILIFDKDGKFLMKGDNLYKNTGSGGKGDAQKGTPAK